MDRFPLDFLIVGTMKSGTSSLGYYASQNPEVNIPEMEGHFFDRHYEKGLDWYKQYLLTESTDQTKVFGEKTPAYAWSETYAKQIKAINPAVKLVWIFRNPVNRAFSHYLHNYKSGAEYLGFDKALSKEKSRIKKDINLGYHWASIYIDQVNVFLKHFSKEQMHFILFEDLKKDSLKVVNNLFDFLEVSKVDKIDSKVVNKTLMPKHPVLRYFVRQTLGRENRVWNKVYGFTTPDPNNPEKIPTINPETAERLKKDFEPFNRQLEALIGREIGYW